jgi:hypothetical protein
MASKKLTDSDILARAQQEVTSTIGRWGSEISNERAAALDYYLGEQYGDEVEGRSQVITREVMETVEWILPSLVRIFCDADTLVAFDPVGPEDEDVAEQETDVVNHVFWKQNKGFYNVYTFLKDALLSKTGILKVWWEDKEEEKREEYQGIDEMGLMQLLEDKTVEREPLDISQDENGLITVSFKATRKRGRIRIEPVPPEEFGVNRDASSPYAKDAKSCYHRVKKTKSELIEEGYSKELVESLPTSDDVDTPEQIARDRLDDEGMAIVYTTDDYWITECYLYADRNGDGIDDLLKVTYAGDPDGGGSATLLDIEEVDRIPFSTASPIILTHKFYGMSIADLTMDLQHIKSTLLRQVLDNTYLANNSRTVVNDEFVNLDDLLTSRPGGVIRVRGEQPVAAYLTPLPHSPLPQETFPLMEYIDQQIKQRTGVGDEVAGLDKNALANVNTGVAALAYDAARMKIELIARIIAEVGFVPLFRDIHELLQLHQDKEMVLKLRNRWVPVNPSHWREREDMTVKVGMGNSSRQRRVDGLAQVMAMQKEFAAAGAMGQLVNPVNMWMAAKEMMEAMGFQPELFFMDPRTAPPPQPPAPDPQIEVASMQAQAMMMDAQSKMVRAQIDGQKAQAEQELMRAQVALKAREQDLKNEIMTLQTQIKAMASKSDSDNKILSMEVEMKRRATENNLKLLQIQLAEVSKTKDRALEKYKVDNEMTIEMAKLAMDQANEILPGGMIVDDSEMSQMFAFGDEQPVVEAIEVTAVPMEAEMMVPAEAEEEEEEEAPSEAEKAMAVMAEAIIRLEQKILEAETTETEKTIVRDSNGLITSIVERKKRA